MGDGRASRFDGVSYPASDERLLDTVMMMNGPGSSTSSVRGRPGIRPGIPTLITIGSSPEKVVISPHMGVMQDTTGAGTYKYTVPGTVNIDLAARPAAGNTRIDEVIGVVLNSDVRPTDGDKTIDVQVLTGTPSTGTPTAPTIPAGTLQLAELTVPASGTISVNALAQRMVALGGILPVANQAERDAISLPYDGLTVYREDTDTCEQRQNGVWEKLAVAGRGGNPYAEAAGVALCSGSGVTANSTATVNISFPAGRFTQPPLVTYTRGGFVTGSGLILPRDADTVTTTGARLVVVNVAPSGSTSFTNLPLNWRAVQMTAAAAAG